MAIDIDLLRIAKHKKDYQRIIKTVPRNVLDNKTYIILKDFGKYFDKFPSKETIEMGSFLPRFRQWHKELNDEAFIQYAKIMRTVSKDADQDTREGIINELAELTFGTELANIVQEYEEGNLEIPIGELISKKLDDYNSAKKTRALLWDNTPIDELLKVDENNEGLKWRLQALNNCMRPLRGGDLGIIAARPDQGKTTLLASEVTYMAPQLHEDRNVVWFCNEGATGPIVKRIYQAAFGCGISKMVRLSNKGLLIPQYEELLGRRDRIRVIPAHGMHIGQIPQLLEAHNAGLVVYDMLDNFKGFDNTARTDRQLEELYQWVREQGVKYDTVSLATSQISNEGDNVAFPGLGMLKDSKTGKQGACDFQLMIGAKTDSMYDNVRFLGLPKNKLRREGAKGNPRTEVQYLPEIARYADIEEVEDESEVQEAS